MSRSQCRTECAPRPRPLPFAAWRPMPALMTRLGAALRGPAGRARRDQVATMLLGSPGGSGGQDFSSSGGATVMASGGRTGSKASISGSGGRVIAGGASGSGALGGASGAAGGDPAARRQVARAAANQERPAVGAGSGGTGGGTGGAPAGAGGAGPLRSAAEHGRKRRLQQLYVRQLQYRHRRVRPSGRSRAPRRRPCETLYACLRTQHCTSDVNKDLLPDKESLSVVLVGGLAPDADSTDGSPGRKGDGPLPGRDRQGRPYLDPSTIRLRFADPAYPLGRAANLANCRASFCGDVCR